MTIGTTVLGVYTCRRRNQRGQTSVSSEILDFRTAWTHSRVHMRETFWLFDIIVFESGTTGRDWLAEAKAAAYGLQATGDRAQTKTNMDCHRARWP